MRRMLFRLAGLALIVYAALLAALFLGQRGLQFPASDRGASAAQAGLLGFEDVVIETADGQRLVAYWKPPEPGRALVVYFHGNAGSIFDRRRRALLLTENGRGLLMVSYRGYSGSTGSPSEVGFHEDALAAYRFATRAHPPERIVLYGESLGTGVAVRLAAEMPVGAVVLDAPYTATADVAKLIYWYVPVDLLMRDQFRSIDVIDRVSAPVLIMHGDNDAIIPIAFGERLFAAARDPKSFVRLPGVGHERVLESGGLAHVRALLATLEASPDAARRP